MKVVHPCCCLDSQRAAKAIAIVNLVVYSLVFFLQCMIIISAIHFIKNNNSTRFHLSDYMPIVLMIICLILIFANIFLYFGSKNPEIIKCSIWLVITSIDVTFLITTWAITMDSADIVILIRVFFCCVQIFEIWVVAVFVHDIRTGNLKPLAEPPMKFSDLEISDFPTIAVGENVD